MNRNRLDKVIIDTSVLYSLLHLGLLDKLKLIYNEILIPEMVEKELARKNEDLYWVLISMYDEIYIKKCTDYDSISLNIYKISLDPGESEVLAQAAFLDNQHIVLLDEKKARNIAKQDNYKFHGVLYILSQLDEKFKVCEYYSCVKRLQKEINFRLSDKIVNQAAPKQ